MEPSQTIDRIESAKSIYEAFEGAVELYSDHAAFKSAGGGGREFSYADVKVISTRIASGLIREGHLKCPEIGILSENRPEWPIAYLSILAAGGTVVPIDANYKESEIEYIIKHAQLRVLFTSEKFEPLLQSLDPTLTILSFDKDSPNFWEKIATEETLPKLSTKNRTAVLIYTSGTTGTPKAVELTHRNLLANLEGIRETLDFCSDEKFLSLLPLHHTFEATCGFLTPIMAGASICYARSLKSKEIVEDIVRNEISVLCGVPLLFEKIHDALKRGVNKAPVLKRAMFHVLYRLSALGWWLGFKWGKGLFSGLRHKAGLATVRMLVSGGAALSPRISRFFNYIGITLIQGYGLTESSPVISANHPDDVKIGSVGPPLRNVEVKIDRANDEGIGEIIARGESITPGYRDNPEQTAELIQDGWLHTGDLGMIKDGQLWITGRAKNLIVSAAGKNIYPEEIEEKLTGSDRILEAVVFGRERTGRQGEDVCAVVVPDLEAINENASAGDVADQKKAADMVRQVVAEVNADMADYKRITKFEIQFEELEKTSTRKIKRFFYK